MGSIQNKLTEIVEKSQLPPTHLYNSPTFWHMLQSHAIIQSLFNVLLTVGYCQVQAGIFIWQFRPQTRGEI